MTLEEFGQKIKQKYPEYQDLSDRDLGEKMLSKYPVYQDMVTSPPAPSLQAEGAVEPAPGLSPFPGAGAFPSDLAYVNTPPDPRKGAFPPLPSRSHPEAAYVNPPTDPWAILRQEMLKRGADPRGVAKLKPLKNVLPEFNKNFPFVHFGTKDLSPEDFRAWAPMFHEMQPEARALSMLGEAAYFPVKHLIEKPISQYFTEGRQKAYEGLLKEKGMGDLSSFLLSFGARALTTAGFWQALNAAAPQDITRFRKIEDVVKIDDVIDTFRKPDWNKTIEFAQKYPETQGSLLKYVSQVWPEDVGTFMDAVGIIPEGGGAAPPPPAAATPMNPPVPISNAPVPPPSSMNLSVPGPIVPPVVPSAMPPTAASSEFIYRGQPEEFTELQKVDQSNVIDNILIGKGIFTTTSKDIAKGYGKNIFKFEKPKEKIFDLTNASKEELKKIGLTDFTINVYEQEIKLGHIKDAEDILIEGLAHNFLPSDLTWNAIKRGDLGAIDRGITVDVIREEMVKYLRQHGYDWIKHQGGIRANRGEKLHDVYIALSDEVLKSISPPSAPVQETPAVSKEPWEMTRGEYRKTIITDEELSRRAEIETRAKEEEKTLPERQGKAYVTGREPVETLGAPNLPQVKLSEIDAKLNVAAKRHERIVKKALSEGKPVPPEVLKDYPDLKPIPSAAAKINKMVKGEVVEVPEEDKIYYQMIKDEFAGMGPTEGLYPDMTSEYIEGQPSAYPEWFRKHAKETIKQGSKSLKEKGEWTGKEVLTVLDKLEKGEPFKERANRQKAILGLLQDRVAELKRLDTHYKELEAEAEANRKPISLTREIPIPENPQTVAAMNLKEGDTFTINGERFDVHIQEDGMIKVIDGTKAELVPFEDIQIDKGSLGKPTEKPVEPVKPPPEPPLQTIESKGLGKPPEPPSTPQKPIELSEEDDENAIINLEKEPWEPKVQPPLTKATAKKLTPSEYYDLKFKKPGLGKFISPKEYYLRILGAEPLLKPIIDAKKAEYLESHDLNKWIDEVTEKIRKQAPVGERISAKIINKPVSKIADMRNLLDKFPTAESLPPEVSAEDKEIFRQIRNLTKSLLDRTNEVREKLGIEPIKEVKSYIPHFFDEMARQIIMKKYPFPEDAKYILRKFHPSKLHPKRIYNPTEFERKVREEVEEYFSRDLGRLLKTLVKYDLRDIYLSEPYSILRAQVYQMRNIIPAEVRKEMDSFLKHDIFDYPADLDLFFNATFEKPTDLINKMLNPLNRVITNPAKTLSRAIRRLNFMGAIWSRVKHPIRNLGQRLLLFDVYPTHSVIQAQFTKLPEELKDTDFYKLSKKFEDYPGTIKKIERAGMAPYGWSHMSNVKLAMKTGYLAGKELQTNKKYIEQFKARAKKDGVPEKQYLWTHDDVIREAQEAGSLTQWLYFKTDMPWIYRSEIGKAVGVFQSWPQNYLMKHWRENFIRARTGKTSWGKPIPNSWRLNALKGLLIILGLTEGLRRKTGLDYGRFLFLWGPLPAYLSPPGQITLGAYKYLIARTDRQRAEAVRQIKYSWKAFIPGSMAWRDFSRYMRGKDTLKEFLFYTEKKK